MAIIHTFLLHLLLLPRVTASTSIHDLLKTKGLPPGLFPKRIVKSYELNQHGLLQVYLERPCLTKFETRVFYDHVVRANLSYGSLTGVEGLSQEELFLWLPVKDIIVYDPSSGLILFDIGVAYKQMPLSLFEDPPLCHAQRRWKDGSPRKGLGFQIQR
ncbi:serine protease [Perilla frutescens var. hirtella]|nr:serine protease [Perilla frutescens var. hirtella]